MAPQHLAAARDSCVKWVGRWLRDGVWPTLDPPSTNLADDVEQPKPEIDADADEDVVRTVYERLCAELETEAERRRAVENKLIAAGSVAPIAVTIMVAVATFLSRGRLQESVSESAVITFVAFYAALQFLRATLAAINGLSRKSYNVPTVSEILPASTEALVGYLRNACNDHVRRLEQHRETTNENVSQLALAHKSIKNAVTAIVIALLILVGLIAWEYVGLAREARTVQELKRFS